MVPVRALLAESLARELETLIETLLRLRGFGLRQTQDLLRMFSVWRALIFHSRLNRLPFQPSKLIDLTRLLCWRQVVMLFRWAA